MGVILQLLIPHKKKSFQVIGGTYYHDLDLLTCSWHVLFLFLNSLYVYLQKKQIKEEATKNLKKETEDESVKKVIYKDKNKYLLGSLDSNDTDISQMVMLYQNWCNIIQAFSKICLFIFSVVYFCIQYKLQSQSRAEMIWLPDNSNSAIFLIHNLVYFNLRYFLI